MNVIPAQGDGQWYISSIYVLSIPLVGTQLPICLSAGPKLVTLISQYYGYGCLVFSLQPQTSSSWHLRR